MSESCAGILRFNFVRVWIKFIMEVSPQTGIARIQPIIRSRVPFDINESAGLPLLHRTRVVRQSFSLHCIVISSRWRTISSRARKLYLSLNSAYATHFRRFGESFETSKLSCGSSIQRRGDLKICKDFMSCIIGGRPRSDDCFEYLVKWRNLDYDSCTWEMESTIEDSDIIAFHDRNLTHPPIEFAHPSAQ
jgi:hypothetical protein